MSTSNKNSTSINLYRYKFSKTRGYLQLRILKQLPHSLSLQAKDFNLELDHPADPNFGGEDTRPQSLRNDSVTAPCIERVRNIN